MTNDASNYRRFFLSAFGPSADGVTDDTEAFRRCFLAAAAVSSAEVIIEPGTYALSGSRPVPLSSNLQVTATGATFNLQEELGDQARIVLFQGEDLCRVHWRGGRFAGHCFDHLTPPNRWEPNANTRILLFTTSAKGRTDRITVEDVQGEGVAGAVITVSGYPSATPPKEKKGSGGGGGHSLPADMSAIPSSTSRLTNLTGATVRSSSKGITSPPARPASAPSALMTAGLTS